MSTRLLQLDKLQMHFFTDKGVVKAVDGVSFELAAGETLAIVGESGCGKSMTAHSILRLIPFPGRITGGKIVFNGEDLAAKSERAMERIRGNDIAMIFQEPMTSLNPVYTVGEQISEAVRVHTKMSKKEAWQKAVEMLSRVGIPLPEQRAKAYPHQLSGGMRQRAMIAMALACNPKLLIADEPTTALDVTIQAQILDLMRRLQKDYNTAILFITHDLGVVAEMADRVAVMYLGRIVEEGKVGEIFHHAKHPYTKGLLKSIPVIEKKVDRLPQIEGMVPGLLELPKGCPFHPRCQYAQEKCKREYPKIKDYGNHRVACWYPAEAERSGKNE